MLSSLLSLALTSTPLASAAEGEAEKPDLPVTFTEEFKLRYWSQDQTLETDEGEVHAYDYVEQVNRLSASGSFGDWTVNAQVDEVALFRNQFYLDDELVVERELVDPDAFSPTPGFSYLNVEKLMVRHQGETATITLGDHYASFGRGIVLNLNRNVDVDVDSSIQGVKAEWRPGAWDVTGVIGQINRQQVYMTNPNVGISGDKRHAVAGLRAERYGLGPANVGVHGVAWSFTEEAGLGAGFQELGTTPDALAGGATVEVFGVGGVDWFLEADGFGFPTDTLFGGQETEPGYAVYGSAAIYWGLTTWLVEGKRYKNAERLNSLLGPEFYEVATGPTLEYERATTEDSSAALNSNDIYGGRVRLDISAAQGVVPYAAVTVLRDKELGGLHFNEVPETIIHPVGGLELTIDHWAVLLNMGYRIDDRDGTEGGSDRQLHGDLDFKFPLGHGWLGNISSGIERYQWGNNPLQQTDYFETENAVSIQYGSKIGLIGYLDYSDNPLIDTTGNLADDLYGALEIQFKPTSAITMKAFYGAYKAGIRCSGGQCRMMPGFEGARFTFVGTF